jgi:TRAP-type transport system small permease protein
MKIDSAVEWVERVVSVPSKVLHWASMILLCLLMFMTVGDVVGRYLVGIIPGFGPIPGSFELTELMLAVIVLTAIGHTQMKDGHISIELFIERFPLRVQAIVDTITNFLSLAMYVLVTWRTIVYARLLYESHDVTGILRLPMYPFLTIAALGTFMFCLAMLSSFLRTLRKAVKNES